MKERPKRLEEVPRLRREAHGGPLSESEEDVVPVVEAEVGDHGDAGGSAGANNVEKALLELTKIAGRLAANKTKKEQLEALLDGVGSGSATGSEGSSGGGKRNAAALRALTKCVKENPKYIYEVIESNLQSDFQSRPVQPGEPLRSRNYGARLVSCEEQSAELPESCSMGVASGWSVGFPHIGKGRRSEGEMCPPCWSGRPSQHRPRKLVDFECLPAGTTAPLPALCKPCCSQHSGDAAYGALRPAVGRLVSQSSQGGRCLCGDQEETGRQIKHYEDGEARWRRARTSPKPK